MESTKNEADAYAAAAATTTTTTANEAQQQHQPELVELATLVLPASATGAGLETGEGTLVILEASSETVEQIQLIHTASNVNTANQERTTEQQQQHPSPPTTHISAVVDLEKLSELVGVSEEEFITGLHHDVQENREEKEIEEEECAVAGEETPLISAAAPPSTIIQGDGEMGDLESAASVSSSQRSGGGGNDKIELAADPFIESLAEVLPPLATLHEGVAFVDDSPTVHTEQASAAMATTTDDQQQFCHDAFLLAVPQTDADGNASSTSENRYVLALPEIHLEQSSVMTDVSGMSDGSTGWKFTVLHGMERAMSILPATLALPTDMESVHLEATEHTPTKADPNPVHLDIVVDRKVPVIGYVILFSGLIALASVGAALDLQHGGVSPLMKTLWRQIATCMVLSPMVLKSLHDNGLPKLSSAYELALLPLSGAAYAYMCLAFVLALNMTTLANAFVLSNMTSLVIIAGRAVLGLPVLLTEGAGAITGFIGAAVCAQGASKEVSSASPAEAVLSNDTNIALLGNVVALSASFGTAGYLLIAKQLRPKMDLFVFMFSVMFLGSLFLILFSVLSGHDISFGFHPVHGIFGWMQLQADRLPLELYMAIVCNCLGTTGYIAVMKYFDPIVPATVMLLEPVIGALLGTAAGTAPLPGLQTWLGDFVVAGGTFLVIKAGAKTTESIDATDTLRPRLNGTTATSDNSITKSPLLSLSMRKRAGGDDSSAKVIWDTT